jgi:hypothetical protein
MTDTAIQEGPTDPGVPTPPPDEENEALIDAAQAYKITIISAVLFVLASLLIILRTRMG